MRWTELFDDLEAQLRAQEIVELQGEVAEHTRSALGQVRLAERFLADEGRALRLRLRGGLSVQGRLTEVAPDWLVVQDVTAVPQREVLVVLAHVLAVEGLSGRSDRGRPGRIQRGLDLRMALRALSRDRALVRVSDIEGGVTVGTIDRVGSDHLDLSTHPDDLPRRTRDLQSVVTMPYAALALVARA